MSDAWLSCKVVRGMFSDEVIIVLIEPDGVEREFFVPRTQIEMKGDAGADRQPGRLRVRVADEKDSILAEIPTPQPQVVFVRREDVQLVP